jgi:hypothetical protein
MLAPSADENAVRKTGRGTIAMDVGWTSLGSDT